MTDKVQERVEIAERLRAIQPKDKALFGFYHIGKAVWEALGGDVELCDVPRLLAELVDPTTETDFEAPWQVCKECHCKFAGYNIKHTRDAVNERVKDAEVLWHDGAGLLLAQLSNPSAAERIRAICNTAQPTASVGPDGERYQELSRGSVMQLEAIADELEGVTV